MLELEKVKCRQEAERRIKAQHEMARPLDVVEQDGADPDVLSDDETTKSDEELEELLSNQVQSPRPLVAVMQLELAVLEVSKKKAQLPLGISVVKFQPASLLLM